MACGDGSGGKPRSGREKALIHKWLVGMVQVESLVQEDKRR